MDLCVTSVAFFRAFDYWGTVLHRRTEPDCGELLGTRRAKMGLSDDMQPRQSLWAFMIRRPAC